MITSLKDRRIEHEESHASTGMVHVWVTGERHAIIMDWDTASNFHKKRDFIRVELERRRRDALFPAGRHDRFKGFRA